MSLLSTARALDDQHFAWRVRAACLLYASDNVTAGGNQGNYARAVMMDPNVVDPAMLAFVATDASVSEAVVVAPDGTVTTSTVQDVDIIAAVTAAWPKVASKYTTDPLGA